LITDGEVWNIEEIIATVRASGQRIYAVGVGSAPSESLLKDMADVTSGACEMVTPRENMQQAVERLLIQIRQTQAFDQEVSCAAPIVWQSKSAGHAAAGSSLMSWTQINIQGTALNELNVVQTIHPNGQPIPCPVIWDESLELSRIAAAFRLNDMSQAKERERLAVEYQLVTSETNLILVHERVESEKAEDLPGLHQVRPMLASGWGGNGTVAYSRSNVSLRVMRTGSDNVPFMAESRINMSHSVPSVWRSSRTHSAARVDGMSNAGMDDIEIPAFLRKQESSSDSKPVKTIVQKFQDIVSTPNKPQQSTQTVKKPHGTSDELKAILANKANLNSPIHELLISFNQTALTHTRFRSALAACLRTNQTNYMEWLITKHMKAAGSGAPIWAIFISWAAENLSVELDRHAERILRDFLSSIDSDLQKAINAELSELKQEAAL
jgi:Ca-activated chloride channel family protein